LELVQAISKTTIHSEQMNILVTV